MGELLFKVSGISSKTSDFDEEDEVVAEAAVAESSKRALVEVLGTERRNRILAALYLVRQDGVGIVRQTSIHIWKALVHNTPRTGTEVVPPLCSIVSNPRRVSSRAATRIIQPDYISYFWRRVRATRGDYNLIELSIPPEKVCRLRHVVPRRYAASSARRSWGRLYRS